MNADTALEECRRILAMPPRHEAWWNALAKGERKVLIESAGLTLFYPRAGVEWADLSSSAQTEIIEAAHRAAAWAARIVRTL